MFELSNWKQDHYDLYHPFRALEAWEKEFWNPTFRSDFRVDLQDKRNANAGALASYLIIKTIGQGG